MVEEKWDDPLPVMKAASQTKAPNMINKKNKKKRDDPMHVMNAG